MKMSCVALATTLAMAMTASLPAEAGSRGFGGGHGGYGGPSYGNGYGHSNYGNNGYGKHGRNDRGGPILGAKAGAQVGAKLNVLGIIKVKAGLGLGLGLGLLGGR